jgi:hypothetical protein
MFSFCSKRVKPFGRQPAGIFLRGRANAPRRSGDDVGRDLVFDEGDAVAQLQLALLQSLQPQQIGGGRLMQRIDRRVEIAVLLLQPRQLGMQLALIFVSHDVR